MTNTVPPSSSPQFLDKLKVERERGITVKAQTVSIIHTHTDGQRYLINLIDTPGHVDFSYEVSRSLGACEGGLLLVDCTRKSYLTIATRTWLTALRRGYPSANPFRLSPCRGSGPHIIGSHQQGRPTTCRPRRDIRADCAITGLGSG
jgi:hypothetical protein